MTNYGLIFQYTPHAHKTASKQRGKRGSGGFMRKLGLGLLAVALGGIMGPFIPSLRLETGFLSNRARIAIQQFNNVAIEKKPSLPPAVPVLFNPLVTEDGASIDPINTDFSLIVPKVGINAPVIPSVNPADPGKYLEALKTGVAHASTSFFPNENGTVYLFSHSTNYDWFVKDLNAVFYLLKNLNENDLIVIFYQGKRYTYRLREKRIVKPSEISYLVPQSGKKSLILQTCWPPGSVSERLLIFADLIEEIGIQI